MVLKFRARHLIVSFKREAHPKVEVGSQGGCIRAGQRPEAGGSHDDVLMNGHQLAHHHMHWRLFWLPCLFRLPSAPALTVRIWQNADAILFSMGIRVFQINVYEDDLQD